MPKITYQNVDSGMLTDIHSEIVSESSFSTKKPILSGIQPLVVAKSENPVLIYLARLAPGSRPAMKRSLVSICELLSSNGVPVTELPWHELRYQHTQAIRTELSERYSHATANKTLSALRGVLQECWRLGYMQAEDYRRAVDVKNVKGTTLPRGRSLSQGEIGALFRVCIEDATHSGQRDAAILAVLYAGGLRRAEAVGLDLVDYEPQNGALTIRAGKGNKARIVYASNGSKDAIEAWLAVRGDDPGSFFYRIRRGGHIVTERLTPQSILHILSKRRGQAKIKPFSPHDLRRSFISDLLDAGADIVTVQKLAGHANPSTTSRYDRRGERVKMKAASMLHVPYSCG